MMIRCWYEFLELHRKNNFSSNFLKDWNKLREDKFINIFIIYVWTQNNLQHIIILSNERNFVLENIFRIRNSALEVLMIFQVAVSLIDSISQSGSEANKLNFSLTSEPPETFSNQKISYWVQKISEGDSVTLYTITG